MEHRGRHPRGRLPYYQDLEKQILRELSDSKGEIGYNRLFSTLGIDPRTSRAHLSKSTLSSTLKLLLSQNKIRKNEKGKYVIRPGEDHSQNVGRLKILLNNLDEAIPHLKNKEKACIGIKLWTLIFLNHFYPAERFMTTNYHQISNEVSRSLRKKTIREFLESRYYTPIFEDDMYRLFFDFCGQFSSEVLEEVMEEVVFRVPSRLSSDDAGQRSLAKSFHKEIFIQRVDYETYYGTAFCNILLDIKPEAFNKEVIQTLKTKINL